MSILTWIFKPWSHQNSMGVRYYLFKKDVVLRGGKEQRIYFFNVNPHYRSQYLDLRPAYPVYIFPQGYTLNENKRNGFLTLTRNYVSTEEDDD